MDKYNYVLVFPEFGIVVSEYDAKILQFTLQVIIWCLLVLPVVGWLCRATWRRWRPARPPIPKC
jgi:hypothetical protein